MAKKAMINKQQRTPKYSTRAYNRCKICGRPHAYLRKFGICRICFFKLFSHHLFSLFNDIQNRLEQKLSDQEIEDQQVHNDPYKV